MTAPLHKDTEALLSIPCSRWRTRQAIVLGWHDGPEEGVCRLSNPEYEFYFEVHSEKRKSDDLGDRLFLISQIKSGSVARILVALRPLGDLKTPIWTPIWRFANEAERVKAERTIDAVIRSKQETGVIVRTRDMKSFTDCLDVSRDIKKFLRWFEYKGPGKAQLASVQ